MQNTNKPYLSTVTIDTGSIERGPSYEKVDVLVFPKDCDLTEEEKMEEIKSYLWSEQGDYSLSDMLDGVGDSVWIIDEAEIYGIDYYPTGEEESRIEVPLAVEYRMYVATSWTEIEEEFGIREGEKMTEEIRNRIEDFIYENMTPDTDNCESHPVVDDVINQDS